MGRVLVDLTGRGRLVVVVVIVTGRARVDVTDRVWWWWPVQCSRLPHGVDCTDLMHRPY